MTKWITSSARNPLQHRLLSKARFTRAFFIFDDKTSIVLSSYSICHVPFFLAPTRLMSLAS